jgi:hypothetical protein
MTDNIGADLLERLRQLAKKEDRSPDELLADLLDTYAAPDRLPIPPPADMEARYEKARLELLPPT